MSRHHRNAGARRDRASLYSEITDRIIAELEAGRVPWGTAAAKAPLAMPQNAATGRRYSGINVLLLWGAVIERGFSGQNWLTFRQMLSLGGNIRKGERGTTVVYADRFVPEDEKKRAAETGEDPQAIPFLKRFTVFNTDQCENLPEDVTSSAPPVPEELVEPTIETLIGASGIDFRIGGNRAFYMSGRTMCRCRRRRPISNRSTGTARHSTSSGTRPGIRHGLYLSVGGRQPAAWQGDRARG